MKIKFMTNKTSRNGFLTGKTGAISSCTMTQYTPKTHTLNIVEDTECKHSIGKHKAAYNQHTQSYRSKITEEQTRKKAALHKKTTYTDYDHYNQSERLESFQGHQQLT